MRENEKLKIEWLWQRNWDSSKLRSALPEEIGDLTGLEWMYDNFCIDYSFLIYENQYDVWRSTYWTYSLIDWEPEATHSTVSSEICQDSVKV